MTKHRDMSKTYERMTTLDLGTLKSKKRLRIEKIENSWSYLHRQEVRRLRFALEQIDVELNCRRDQLALFE